jgi:predicted permease
MHILVGFREILNALGSRFVLMTLGYLANQWQVVDGPFIKQICLIVFKVLFPMRLVDQFWRLDFYRYSPILLNLIPLYILKIV